MPLPEAYENYTMYETIRMNNVSPTMPGELDSPFTYSSDSHTMSTAGKYSPSSMGSPQDMDVEMREDDFANEQFYGIAGNNTKITICNPELRILAQPIEKFRFRYKSEMMGTHGSLLGERENSLHKKEVPTVQLISCPIKNAVIRCTLVTTEEDNRFPHAHRLIRKNGNEDCDDPHDIEVSEENNYTAMFCNMGIIHTAKKHVKDEILRKKKRELLEEKRRKDPNAIINTREDLDLRIEVEQVQKWMNLNSVALCFQGFAYGENNILHPITNKIYSRAINNLKSVKTGELRICQIDKLTGSCEGQDVVWLLVEKVDRKNIKVKFYEVDEKDNTLWEADGRFSELDVHHQYAIILSTPPYKDINITEPKQVFIKLVRPSDGEISNSVKFTYKPTQRTLNGKRPRISSLSENSDIQNPFGNTPMAEVYTNFDKNSSSNLSTEIRKLMETDANIPPEMNEFSYSSLFEKYVELVNQPEKDSLLLPGYAVDGDSSELESDEFAGNTLQNIYTIFKEIDSKTTPKQTAIIKVLNLLQETTNFGDTPLHFALRYQQYEIAKCIVKILAADSSFAKIGDLSNSEGKTPLHMAVLENQANIVRALLKLGVDLNKSDEEDATALHNAVLVEANECLDELLKYKTTLNIKAHTESGWSALHLATKVGSLYAVRALINAGADVNSTDMSRGRTALHIAVDNNHKHVVIYLLTETKIDINMKDYYGSTALRIAEVKGGKSGEELVKILKQYGAVTNTKSNEIIMEHNDEEKTVALSEESTGQMDTASIVIKTENSDYEEKETVPEKSFCDLAISSQVENLEIKQESDDEIMMQQQAKINVHSIVKETLALQQQKLETTSKLDEKQRKKLMEQQQQQEEQKRKQQLEQLGQGDDKLAEKHIKKLIPILDKTGDWERLAQHMNLGSLIRLHKKTSSPSTALFRKIKLQNPNITVRQMKKLLIDIKSFEAASKLENR